MTATNPTLPTLIQDSDNRPTLNHAQMHVKHLQWSGDNSLWRDDLAMWQREIKQARVDFELLKKAFDEHEEQLRQHGASVRLYEQDARQHEHVLAEYKQGGSGSTLCSMAQAHETEQKKHCELFVLHEGLKRRQHTVMAHWNLLLNSLVAKPCSRNCKHQVTIGTGQELPAYGI